MNCLLTIYLHPNEPVEHILDREKKTIYSLGRKLDCDIVISSLLVSKVHCTLTQSEDCWLITDGVPLGEGSKNGTWINGQKIKATLQLNHQDIITFGPEYPRAIFTEEIIEKELGTTAFER